MVNASLVGFMIKKKKKKKNVKIIQERVNKINQMIVDLKNY